MTAVSHSATVDPPTPPLLEAPPPPPPPVDESDAGKEETVKAPKGRRAVGGGCEGQCKGTANGTLRSALAGRGGQARGCYERALRNNAGAEGRLLVALRIGPQGQVCSASVSDQGLGDPGVVQCVRRMFLTGTFPPPAGGCVDVQVPLNFVRKE
ncbi:AgmX/PglI C-terminal domain-containing protein [Myxococcota bacterium]